MTKAWIWANRGRCFKFEGLYFTICKKQPPMDSTNVLLNSGCSSIFNIEDLPKFPQLFDDNLNKVESNLTVHKWQSEFSSDFNVPIELSQHPLLEDTSWHNDVCPSFKVIAEKEDNQLWSDHPIISDREVEDGLRFTFVIRSEIVFETDNLSEMLEYINKIYDIHHS